MPALSESLPAAPPMEPARPPQGGRCDRAADVPKLLGAATARRGGDEEEGEAHKHAAASTGGAGKKADEENMEKVPSGWATTSLNKDDSSSSIGSPQSPGPRRNASGITRVSSASKRVVDAGRREFCCYGLSWSAVAEVFTTPVNTEAEGETAGWAVQLQVRGPPPGSDASFKSMARRFAKHCCTEMKYFPIPLVFTLIPTILTSLMAGKWSIGGLVDPPWTCDPKESTIMLMCIERARTWSLLFCPFMLFWSAHAMIDETATYCRTPSGPEFEQYNLTSTWMSCRALDSLLNATALS